MSRRIPAPVREGALIPTKWFEEGDVVIQWPEKLSAESFEDLESWMEILMRKIGRRVTPSQPAKFLDGVAEDVVDDG